MASGRTVDAKKLTRFDKKVIGLCRKISDALSETIPEDDRDNFRREYGRIHDSRDAERGRGGGKLQRDALCTRGKADKAPFSNRNLRWHPLVVAEYKPYFAREIERIEVSGTNNRQLLKFVIRNEEGKETECRPLTVHKLKGRYVALPKHWEGHTEKLKGRTDSNWNKNSCVIPAYEACNWWNAVETYAVLGISIAVNFFGVEFDNVYGKVARCLEKQTVDKDFILPSKEFPTEEGDIVQCPLCLRKMSEGLEEFRSREREDVWKPPWSPNRRREGDDSSIQIMHVKPLVESEIRHTAANVRYGHRWCNVAMTDHSLEETMAFMKSIVHANSKGK